MWTSNSVSLGIVFCTVTPSLLALMVALHGTARAAAPDCWASATTARTSAGETRGRAESWTATYVADGTARERVVRPLETESCRSLPGLAKVSRGGAPFWEVARER